MAQQLDQFTRKQNINDAGFTGYRTTGVIQDPNLNNVVNNFLIQSNRVQYQNLTIPTNQSGYKKETYVEAERPAYHQIVQGRSQAISFRKGQ